jgi:hypothetical protein
MHVLGYGALAAVHAALLYGSMLCETPGDVASVILGAVVLHLLEAAAKASVCCSGHSHHDDHDVPVMFQRVPWIEIPEHLGTALLLYLALAYKFHGVHGLHGPQGAADDPFGALDDPAHTGHAYGGGPVCLYLVTLPALHAAMRAFAEWVARRRVQGASSDACLLASTLVMCLRCVTYMAFECAPFALHVLELDPVYAAHLPLPAAFGVRVVCCVLAYTKMWWMGRTAVHFSALCT